MPTRPSLIDTHCHLDAAEFDADRQVVASEAASSGVGTIVIPAVGVQNFKIVARLARNTVGGCYALGIHPLVTPGARETDIATLRDAVVAALDDPRFVAIGEIGLDLFVPSLVTPDALTRQTWFFDEQLKIARDFDLPVLLHVRRAQDQVLAGLRRVRRSGSTNRSNARSTGIAHAFNGSRQQADHYLALGFKLGFGGAATHERALRIRALARELPIDALVLETDAPDIPPAWLRDADGKPGRNAPGELARIAATIATLRGTTLDDLASRTTRNACAVLPRLADVIAALPEAVAANTAASGTASVAASGTAS